MTEFRRQPYRPLRPETKTEVAPLEVRCPRCCRMPGEDCNSRKDYPMPRSHRARREAAELATRLLLSLRGSPGGQTVVFPRAAVRFQAVNNLARLGLAAWMGGDLWALTFTPAAPPQTGR